MRSDRRLYAAAGALVLAAASACSSAPPPAPQAESVDAPAPPAITSPEVTTISAVPEAAENLKRGGRQAADEWYVGTLRAADVTDSRQSLLDLRSEVCSMLDARTSAANLLRALGDRGYPDPEQQGVILASAMTSYCPDASVAIPVTALDGVSVDTEIPTDETSPVLPPEEP